MGSVARRPWTRAAITAISLAILGLVWSFASPHGSSADDDFHLTSIWCSHGESAYCQPSGDDVGVVVPRIIAYPSCYVTWPATTSAGCVRESSYELIYTPRVDPPGGDYPDGFHWVMGFLAGQDVPASVQLMRIANTLIASSFLLFALIVLQPSLRRAVSASWAVGLIPLGIFFIASTNPSSWVITGVGLYWAFLLSALWEPSTRQPVFWARALGAVGAGAMALVARSDAAIYLFTSTVAMLIIATSFRRMRRKFLVVGGLGGLMILLVFAYLSLRDRYGFSSISWPGAQTATDQPNPVLKTLLEIPGFVVGLIGGQRPGYVLSDSGFNQGADGYRPTGLLYGLGWAEVQLPSVVAISGLVSVVVLVTVGLNSYRASRLIAILFLVIAAVGQILIMRSMVDFAPIWEIQPRYFVPIFVAILGVFALRPELRGSLLTRVQGLVVVMSVIVGGSVAWMATAARYAIGPDAAFTNFGQTPDWWWEVGPSRLIWFLLAIGATALWAWASIWNFGTKPVFFEDRTQVRTSSLD